MKIFNLIKKWISGQTDRDTGFKFVTRCGRHGRTIFEAGGTVHIGCFKGSYRAASRAIHREYKGAARDEYLAKLRLLKEGGEPFENFSWAGSSWAVAVHCPEHLDPERYNWEWCSWAVAEYCPDKLDPERYNWEKFSWAVAEYCPDKLDPDRYNWEKFSWAVELYCPDKLKLKPKGK